MNRWLRLALLVVLPGALIAGIVWWQFQDELSPWLERLQDWLSLRWDRLKNRIFTPKNQTSSGGADAAAAPDGSDAQAVEALDLREPAHSAALALRRKFPEVKFTSGRRDPRGQCRAMAQNVAKDRDFIKGTYHASTVKTAMQAWLDANPDVVDPAALEAGLFGVLSSFSPDDQALISRHLSGLAFDVQPMDGRDDVVAFIEDLDGLDTFLTKESGLTRWHAQFESPEATS